ncbi:MAG: hypothetical protein N2C14_02070 [Planctomycetales bacterium]
MPQANSLERRVADSSGVSLHELRDLEWEVLAGSVSVVEQALQWLDCDFSELQSHVLREERKRRLVLN